MLYVVCIEELTAHILHRIPDLILIGMFLAVPSFTMTSLKIDMVDILSE